MRLKGKDVYRVELNENLGEDAISSLVSLYLPIIGNDAVLLYLLLHSEGRLQRTQESHSRLFELLGKSPDEIEQARIHLEEFLLLRAYVQEGESRNSYIYHLNAPLPSESFLSSRDFYAMYVHAVGKKQAELTAGKFYSGSIPTEGYKDITASVRRLPVGHDYEEAINFQKVSPKYQFSKNDISINFDYEHFFATTSDVVLPNILRTRSNLEEIGRLATLYGLSADRMRILVGHCVVLEPLHLDLDRLKRSAAAAVPDITTAKDPYTLPPVSFLMAKQNGALVSQTDKQILERLSVNMHFPNEVINVMIEYILRISDNRLNSRFVDMVAGEWARDGVRTKEAAFEETKKKAPAGRSSQRKETLPEFYNPDPIRNKDVKPASQEEIEAARRALNAMKGGSGDG